MNRGPSADGPGESRWTAATATDDGRSVAVRVYRHTDQPLSWLVWAHGGSWRFGSTAEWHGALTELARISGCLVVGVDYRLLPHHPHPAPLEDVLTALAWVRGLAAEPGAPSRVAVGGDSAGGTIAACAALAEAEAGVPLAAQVLAYPPIDPRCRAGSYDSGDAFPDRSRLRLAWAEHRGKRPAVVRGGRTLLSTPAEAPTLAGAAPAVMAVGEFDPVRDDVVHYAAALEHAGVPVRLDLIPGTGHGAVLDPHVSPFDIRHRLSGNLRALLGSAPDDRIHERTRT